MEDDHVDRPGVEAQQCVKLTGTNRSIGLIVLIVHAHRMNNEHSLGPDALDALRTGRAKRRDGLWPCGACAPTVPDEEFIVRRVQKNEEFVSSPASQSVALRRPGGHRGVAAPVPFPNTAVKRPCANGTSSQDAGE